MAMERRSTRSCSGRLASRSESLATTAARSAFTLVELLVVIAIIGVLIALLLPAIQMARESSRRINCQNNLRQDGIALLNFESTQRVYPAAGWTEVGPGNPAGKYVGWRALILPYVEESALQAIYDFRQHWWDGVNPAAGAVHISIFMCPSVPERTLVTSVVAKPPRPALTFPQPLAPADYSAVMGVQANINPAFYTSAAATRSVMFRNSRVKAADITDGMSNTIMVVECGARPAVIRNGGQVPDLWNDQGQGWIDSEQSFSLDGANADGTQQGLGPMQTPLAMNVTNENEPYAFHPSGGNFLFADGHVAFLDEDISLETLAALCTRAAGEPSDP